jgi:ABC-type transport system substrate-binding protein
VEAENTGSWWGLEENTFALGGLWANPKAKQALMYSIDRQAYVDAILQGYGRVRDSFFDGTMYACPTMTHYTYDPAKADALWNEIGITKDKRPNYEITYMSWLGNKARLDYLPIAQEYLRKLGFVSNVDLIDNSLQPAYNNGQGPRGKEFSFNVLWYGPGADPGSIDPWLRPGQSSNAYYRSWPEAPDADGKKPTAPYYNNPRVTELLDKAKVESDPEKRKAYFQEIDCIWNQELPSLTTAAASNMVAKSPRLQGLDWAQMAALGQPSSIWRPGDLWIWDQK